MEDQYYISLADSFNSATVDFSVEMITNEVEGRSKQSENGKIASTVPKQIVSPRAIKKQQKMVLNAKEREPSMDQHLQLQQQDSKNRGSKWNKLRDTVQMIIQSSGKTSNNRDRPATPAIDIRPYDGIDDDTNFQQQGLLVKSDSTCSTSTEISDLEEQHFDDDTRDNGRNHIDELAPIEEGDEQRQTEEDYDDLVRSSSVEGIILSIDTSTSTIENHPMNKKKIKGNGLRAQLEDSQMSLDSVNKEKKVLRGQLDAADHKLGTLRKVIQQRSMENSRLNSTLDNKNTVIETKNRELSDAELALKSSQDKNRKLQAEVERLLQLLSVEEMKTRGLQSKLDLVARAGTAVSGSTLERSGGTIGSSAASKPSPAGSVANAFKESKRFLSHQRSYETKHSKAYLKLSNSDEDDKAEDKEETDEASSKDVGPSNAEQSIISTMAKKFNSKPAVQEDSSALRDELEQIRQNLQGKCKKTKSSLENQWLSNIKKYDDEVDGAHDNVNTPKTPKSPRRPTPPKPPKTPAGEGGAFETFFSPLKARIDLLEASCTEHSSRNGYCED